MFHENINFEEKIEDAATGKRSKQKVRYLTKTHEINNTE